MILRENSLRDEWIGNIYVPNDTIIVQR